MNEKKQNGNSEQNLPVEALTVSMQPRELAEVIRQRELVQEALVKVLRKGADYDVISGCGPRPMLLQPGAQKLGFLFRIRPHYEIQRIDHPDGHVSYEVTCQVIYYPTGEVVGEGVGSGSTREPKYAYVWVPMPNTPIPKDYWYNRRHYHMQGYAARRIDGRWR